MANKNAIKKNCNYTICDAMEKVFRFDSNTWVVVHLIDMISTNHICPRVDTPFPIQIRSNQSIRLQPGCHIQTLDHIITAEELEDMEINSIWLD